tara:strand:- start:163 stop:576 length:414 start_codon:yes stop_codon:yes gene_type:complete
MGVSIFQILFLWIVFLLPSILLIYRFRKRHLEEKKDIFEDKKLFTRKQFIFSFFALIIIFIISRNIEETFKSTDYELFYILIEIPAVFGLFYVSIKRLRDLNLNVWFSLFNLIPFTNLVFYIILFCYKGKKEVIKRI